MMRADSNYTVQASTFEIDVGLQLKTKTTGTCFFFFFREHGLLVLKDTQNTRNIHDHVLRSNVRQASHDHVSQDKVVMEHFIDKVTGHFIHYTRYEPRHEKTCFLCKYAKTKAQISWAVTAQLISVFVFAT